MLNLNLYQFTDSGTGCRKILHNEIPFHITIFFKLFLEKIIISVTDYIFKKVFLLNLHSLQAELFLAKIIKVLVHCLNTQIHGFRLEKLHQIALVGKQIFLTDAVVMRMVEIDRPQIRFNRVF